VLFDDLGHDAAAVLRGADVAVVDRGVRAERLDLVDEAQGGLGVTPVAGGDGGALRGERQRDRAADAARAAGDVSDAALELRTAGTGGSGRGQGVLREASSPAS
jgi:hypothetical protein